MINATILKYAAIFMTMGIPTTNGWAQGESKPTTSSYIDYKLYTHKIKLKELRAGTHDESGTNEYYFSVVAKAKPEEQIKQDIPSSEKGSSKPDEEKKPESEEELPKEVTKDLGKFAELKIEALAVWKSSKESTINDTINIDGSDLRHLVSTAMQTYSIPENEVKLWIDVVMLEKNSYLGLVGEDTKLHTFVYQPIAKTKPKLIFSDSNGTRVNLTLKYKSKPLDGK